MGDELGSAQEALSSFNNTVSKFEETLKPLLKAAVEARDDESVPALTKARVNATLAYALNALYYVYLRANTVDPGEHPINEDLERVQKLFVRLRVVEREAGERDNTDLHGLRIATERLDEFLLPEEEAIFQASKGSTEEYKRHKVFDSGKPSTSTDSDAKKTRKKSTKNKSVSTEEQTAGYDGDAEMTPVQKNSTKKKSRSAKVKDEVEPELKLDVEEVAEPESMDIDEAPKKTPKKTSKKTPKKKKKVESVSAQTDEEEEENTESSTKKLKKKKKKRDSEIEEETPKPKKRKSKRKKAESES